MACCALVSPKRRSKLSALRALLKFPLPRARLRKPENMMPLFASDACLRGDTAHYDVIVNEVTRGIGQSAQETGVPHAFGVLTCETLEQAIDRAGLKMGNKGFEAAQAAIEMANLKRAISTQHSAVSEKKQIPRRYAPRNDKKSNSSRTAAKKSKGLKSRH